MRIPTFTVVTTERWNNYHFIHSELDTITGDCYSVTDTKTLCGSLDTKDKEYKDILEVIKQCQTEKELLQYSINLFDKKIVCAKCIGYFFSDEQD